MLWILLCNLCKKFNWRIQVAVFTFSPKGLSTKSLCRSQNLLPISATEKSQIVFSSKWLSEISAAFCYSLPISFVFFLPCSGKIVTDHNILHISLNYNTKAKISLKFIYFGPNHIVINWLRQKPFPGPFGHMDSIP